MTEVVIYTAKDGHIKLDVTLSDETVWLSMAQMVQLFGRDKSVISRHLNNIFKVDELSARQLLQNMQQFKKKVIVKLHVMLNKIRAQSSRFSGRSSAIKRLSTKSKELYPFLLIFFTTHSNRLSYRFFVSQLSLVPDVIFQNIKSSPSTANGAITWTPKMLSPQFFFQGIFKFFSQKIGRLTFKFGYQTGY